MPNPSMDVIDFVVSKQNGVTGLSNDFPLQTLPPPYILPPEERLLPGKILCTDQIPIFDVGDWSDARVASQICDAASRFGFFQVVNHGIPMETMDAVTAAARAFYALPSEERRRFWKGNPAAETVFLQTSFSPMAEAVLEWKDYLMFSYDPENDEASSLWPSVCKDQVMEYMKSAQPVIKNLLAILMKNLNVNEIDESLSNSLMGSFKISFNHYPKCPNPDLAAGVGRHSDISAITVLLQDDVGGLYVRANEQEEDDRWIHVAPTRGALVINVGDVLQMMSNDLYKSIEHRVVASGARNRVSVPIFVNPREDAAIKPLPEAVAMTGEAAVYREIVFSDYFSYFFSKGHDGKKTIDFAKIK
ncbi:PREDICTED: feruloyl CoA ortho-hydroxylase 1-like [Tarenaya hassleriana]|uniref:feruloyl CoA ortho-hydroxylase 1-like n=1 Tax=Tarenaya hassleriana TaxID=28532 RepID=UPI00053C0BE9|nr:PREDICTED: feruloyl CoA ortho-hydroxylase 1-like [Tarenaya hassleriana]